MSFSSSSLILHPSSFIKSLWKFSRPHTIIGTSLSVLALYFIALGTTNIPISPSNIKQMLAVWIACLCGNIYIVGLNQLTDVEIDRINKPHLPVASGAFTIKQGWGIVAVMGLIAIAISAFSGTWLLATVAVSLIIGTAYSLPPIRLKQFPFFAAFCILTVRGIVVNLGLFLHYSQRFQGQEVINADVWLLTLFILLFTIAIAIFKDVPDLEGDKKYNIATFSLILGKTRVFQITCGVIAICYLGMIAAGIIGLDGINSSFFVIYHLVLLSLLLWRSEDVNLEEKNAIASFYQFIWKLFFLEYILFPLACFV
ncbi:Homogentisate phytyltransferase [Hyella patelloides LEGE 07179]|uniref:Homogentisate phytyltransferase n=1 Tax=Hyella patelloides LEGE 07179 TaxID=945734 RepID=A0A563W395_9CYAN|nr:homogentisate phytyltransferase [Hyella patelloides]VEP18179.1 Homogentisate phytyltransferase [Hyella patelloides LEGE 07179]